MICIEERKSVKLPTPTSLFLSFNYNADIVNIIKTCYVRNYDKKTNEWEVPIPCLTYLLDRLSNIDEINLKVLKDEENNESKNFDIGPFKTQPFKHQLDAIQYGLNHDKWLLLDAPGLGKSLSIINIANELKKRGEIEHCLIICGINTLKFNWVKEIGLHSDLSCRILGQKINKKGKIVVGGVQDRLADLKKPLDEFFIITNIETLRDEDVVKEMTKGKNKFDMIAFDESHKAKSPQAQQTKGLLKLNAKYKIAATGTLMLNSPEDCYTALKWTENEHSTFTNYKYFYEIFGGTFNNELIGYRNLEMLKSQIENCSLRRTKDLLDLPEKTIIEEEIEMLPEQEVFYNNIKNGIIEQVDKVEIDNTSLLAMVARLRQATACPQMLTTEDIKSAKIERAVELTKELISNNEKVVIFSTFKETLRVLAKELEEYNPLICHGDIKDEIISENIDKFQTDDNSKIILATWQKLGTGVTLTAASYMIFIDCAWTAGVQEQSEDRIHRIGSKKPVFIYRLICKDTIDERVKEILADKEAVSNYVIDDQITAKSLESLRKYIQELQPLS